MSKSYRCGGWSSYYGPCGALDCESCYPGCNNEPTALYETKLVLRIFSNEECINLSLENIFKLESEDNAYIHIVKKESVDSEYKEAEAEDILIDAADELNLNIDLTYLMNN